MEPRTLTIILILIPGVICFILYFLRRAKEIRIDQDLAYLESTVDLPKTKKNKKICLKVINDLKVDDLCSNKRFGEAIDKFNEKYYFKS